MAILFQLKLGMNSHPIDIYRATISIKARVGNTLIIELCSELVYDKED